MSADAESFFFEHLKGPLDQGFPGWRRLESLPSSLGSAADREAGYIRILFDVGACLLIVTSFRSDGEVQFAPFDFEGEPENHLKVRAIQSATGICPTASSIDSQILWLGKHGSALRQWTESHTYERLQALMGERNSLRTGLWIRYWQHASAWPVIRDASSAPSAWKLNAPLWAQSAFLNQLYQRALPYLVRLFPSAVQIDLQPIGGEDHVIIRAEQFDLAIEISSQLVRLAPAGTPANGTWLSTDRIGSAAKQNDDITLESRLYTVVQAESDLRRMCRPEEFAEVVGVIRRIEEIETQVATLLRFAQGRTEPQL